MSYYDDPWDSWDEPSYFGAGHCSCGLCHYDDYEDEYDDDEYDYSPSYNDNRAYTSYKRCAYSGCNINSRDETTYSVPLRKGEKYCTKHELAAAQLANKSAKKSGDGSDDDVVIEKCLTAEERWQEAQSNNNIINVDDSKVMEEIKANFVPAKRVRAKKRKLNKQSNSNSKKPAVVIDLT